MSTKRITHHILCHHHRALSDPDGCHPSAEKGLVACNPDNAVPGQPKSLSPSALVLSCLRDLVSATALGMEVDAPQD